MDVRRLVTALTVPCALVAAERAIGQDRSVYGPQDPVRTERTASVTVERSPLRLPLIEERDQSSSIEMIESWTVGDQAMVGLGKFRVGEVARPRTNVERVRDDLMARENRAIAGAGLQLRFD